MPIKEKHKEQGSVTVEAAIIFPVFLLFLLFFIQLFYAIHVQLTINHAVNDTAKLIATHVYPVKAYHDRQAANPAELTDDYFSEPVKHVTQWIESILTRQAMKHYLLEQYPQLKEAQLQITEVKLPLQDIEQEYVVISVEYRLPLLLPSTNKNLLLRAKATERSWIGVNRTPHNKETGHEDQEYEEQDEENEQEEDRLEITYLSSPVQRGRYLQLEATGKPRTLASITLYYQSGFVKSVPCQSNATGLYKCSIIIGGNAKEGEYMLVMQTANAEASGRFIVLSKQNYQNQ